MLRPDARGMEHNIVDTPSTIRTGLLYIHICTSVTIYIPPSTIRTGSLRLGLRLSISITMVAIPMAFLLDQLPCLSSGCRAYGIKYKV